MPKTSDDLNAVVTKLLQQGRSYHQAGDLVRAKERYDAILGYQPDNADALYLIGLIHYRNGDSNQGMKMVCSALEINDQHALAHASLAQMYQDANDNQHAILHFSKAVELNTESPNVLNGLGLSFFRLGRNGYAEKAFLSALSIDPSNTAVLINLSNLYSDSGSFGQAEKYYRKCISIRPDLVEAHNNLGVLLYKQQKFEMAIESFKRATLLQPHHADALNNLGVVLLQLGDLDSAIDKFKQSLGAEPESNKAALNLGMALQNDGQHEAACTALDSVIERDAGDVNALWARCVANLKSVYLSKIEVIDSRHQYEVYLKRFMKKYQTGKSLQGRSGANIIGSMQPFLLAYQGLPNLNLQKLYGAMVCNIGHTNRLDSNSQRHPGPIRVGVVSAFFYDHSNWKIPIRGWLQALSCEFQLFGFYTGHKLDEITLQAEQVCDEFYSAKSVEKFAQLILQKNIDLIIYPEVGMNPITTRLAAQRLAPVQCVSWGHPDTSGMPSMDYFLSSDLMEPVNAQEFYSENLVKLPGLSFSWFPDMSTSNQNSTLGSTSELQRLRVDLGLQEDDVVYLCVQNLSKYLPQYDFLFSDIATIVPKAKFVFIEGSTYTSKSLQHRLSLQFESAGESYADRVRFLPRMNKEDYRKLNRCADVFLDTPDWSGCNSTMEALDCNLPVVTLPGKLMRARHGFAIYKQMCVSDLIADSLDSYLEIAIRLGVDKKWRREIKNKIAEHKNKLVNDYTPCNSLVDFVRSVVVEN